MVQATLADLKLECCRKFGLEEGDVQVHDYWERKLPTHANLEAEPGKLDDPVSSLRLYHNQDILLMEKVCRHHPPSVQLRESLRMPLWSSCFELCCSVGSRIRDVMSNSPQVHTPGLRARGLHHVRRSPVRVKALNCSTSACWNRCKVLRSWSGWATRHYPVSCR